MIGRDKEIQALRSAMDSDKSEFVVLYGRRRVGKSFLVSEFFNRKFTFHHAGLEGASRRETLASFREALRRKTGNSRNAWRRSGVRHGRVKACAWS